MTSVASTLTVIYKKIQPIHTIHNLQLLIIDYIQRHQIPTAIFQKILRQCWKFLIVHQIQILQIYVSGGKLMDFTILYIQRLDFREKRETLVRYFSGAVFQKNSLDLLVANGVVGRENDPFSVVIV